jgi:hypothetical protein
VHTSTLQLQKINAFGWSNCLAIWHLVQIPYRTSKLRVPVRFQFVVLSRKSLRTLICMLLVNVYVSEMPAASIIRTMALVMEAANYSDMSVDFYLTTRRYNLRTFPNSMQDLPLRQQDNEPCRNNVTIEWCFANHCARSAQMCVNDYEIGQALCWLYLCFR